MFDFIARTYTNYLENRIRGNIDPAVYSRIRLTKACFLVLLLFLLGSIIIELLTEVFLVSLLPKLLLTGIIVQFLLWYRGKKKVGIASTLLMLLLFTILTTFHVLQSLELFYVVIFFFIPLLSFLLQGKRWGWIWVILAGIWIFTIAFLQVNPPRNMFVTLTFAYGITAMVSYLFTSILTRAEQGFTTTNEELKRLIYIISHDLRTPLTSIKGYVSFLREDFEENNFEQVEHDIQRSEQVIDSMQRMINDLLDLSRIGRDIDVWENVNTQQVINGLLVENESQFKNKNIQVNTSGVFPVVFTDARKFEEVLRNLLSNAIKYIGHPELPTITIGVTETPFEYQFFVQDNGLGIAEEDIDKVFELFVHQVDKYQENKSNSSGIGLSVVKGFVTDMGGKVWVESEVDKGSTFWFSVPKQSPKAMKKYQERLDQENKQETTPGLPKNVQDVLKKQ